MNKLMFLGLVLLVQLTFGNHYHLNNPAFSNWVGGPGTAAGNIGTQNPAFANWANRPGTPQGTPNPQGGQNPAFANWNNRPGTPGPQNPQNPAFANWNNRPGTPTTGPQNPAFNNWANRPGTPGAPGPQNPAFANWNNRPGTPGPGPQNPAFNNWNNRPGTPGPQNPAFNNWNNRPGTPGPQNPAFNNWNNRPGSPIGGLSSGRGGFNNWMSSSGPLPNVNSGIRGSQGRAGFNNWMSSSTVNSFDIDSRLRLFLNQNRINVPIPDAASCIRYSVPGSGQRYQVSLVLPNGQRFTQPCTGIANCNLVTCKLGINSRIPGAQLLRIPF